MHLIKEHKTSEEKSFINQLMKLNFANKINNLSVESEATLVRVRLAAGGVRRQHVCERERARGGRAGGAGRQSTSHFAESFPRFRRVASATTLRMCYEVS